MGTVFVRASRRAKAYTRVRRSKKKAATYMVQARLAHHFEDIRVKAKSPKAALRLAKKKTTLQHRFTSFSF